MYTCTLALKRVHFYASVGKYLYMVCLVSMQEQALVLALAAAKYNTTDGLVCDMLICAQGVHVQQQHRRETLLSLSLSLLLFLVHFLLFCNVTHTHCGDAACPLSAALYIQTA